jgi:hypothetical protein
VHGGAVAFDSDCLLASGEARLTKDYIDVLCRIRLDTSSDETAPSRITTMATRMVTFRL